MMSALREGKYYPVRLRNVDDGYVAGKRNLDWQPARFTGRSGGSPAVDTWDLVGFGADDAHHHVEVAEVCPMEIVVSPMTTTRLPASWASEPLPCPFCASENVMMWDGVGTEGQIYCNDCQCSRSVQVVDLCDAGEERPTFDPARLRYPAEWVDRARSHLLDEWNRRAAPDKIGAALAVQLRRSIERNSRMVERLKEVRRSIDDHQPSHEVYDAGPAVDAILQDEAPF